MLRRQVESCLEPRLQASHRRHPGRLVRGDEVDLVRQVAQDRLLDLAPGQDQAEPDGERDADENDDPDAPEQLRAETAGAHLRSGTSL